MVTVEAGAVAVTVTVTGLLAVTKTAKKAVMKKITALGYMMFLKASSCLREQMENLN